MRNSPTILMSPVISTNPVSVSDLREFPIVGMKVARGDGSIPFAGDDPSEIDLARTNHFGMLHEVVRSVVAFMRPQVVFGTIVHIHAALAFGVSKCQRICNPESRSKREDHRERCEFHFNIFAQNALPTQALPEPERQSNGWHTSSAAISMQ